MAHISVVYMLHIKPCEEVFTEWGRLVYAWMQRLDSQFHPCKSSIMAGLYFTFHSGCLMCNQMADVVMKLFWLIQLDQLILRDRHDTPSTQMIMHTGSTMELLVLPLPILYWLPAATTYCYIPIGIYGSSSKPRRLRQAKQSCSRSGLNNQQKQLHQPAVTMH